MEEANTSSHRWLFCYSPDGAGRAWDPDARVEREWSARPINVRDRSVQPEVPTREKAVPGDAGRRRDDVRRRFTVAVKEGERMGSGRQVGTIEAMKMEFVIRFPADGTVERLIASSGTNVEPDDLLAVLEPE